jgi:signal transduction histidine kinase
VARWERRRLRLIDPEPLEDPHVPVGEPGVRAWLRVRLHEQATWRELGWTALTVFGLCWADLGMVAVSIGLPVLVGATPWYSDDRGSSVWFIALVGVALLPVGAYLMVAWAAARATLVRAVLGVQEAELGSRLREVTRSRTRLLADFERERTMIERDLHDGAQRHLVAVSMSLGLARLDLPADAPGADLVRKAHGHAERALEELRALIRGVHPPVLTDRGLAAAVSDIAGDVPVPVEVEVELTHRLAPELEGTSYFCISELLTNVTRHSEATRAWVTVRCSDGVLVTEVGDDGRGGADPGAGRGLAGLADRLSAVEGRLLVHSPPGGPTVVRFEIPATGEAG